jgi:hypothetical protein
VKVKPKPISPIDMWLYHRKPTGAQLVWR